jgi:hypothetical protein
LHEIVKLGKILHHNLKLIDPKRFIMSGLENRAKTERISAIYRPVADNEWATAVHRINHEQEQKRLNIRRNKFIVHLLDLTEIGASRSQPLHGGRTLDRQILECMPSSFFNEVSVATRGLVVANDAVKLKIDLDRDETLLEERWYAIQNLNWHKKPIARRFDFSVSLGNLRQPAFADEMIDMFKGMVPDVITFAPGNIKTWRPTNTPQ